VIKILFCPKCGSILTPKKTGRKITFVCSCGYSSKKKKGDIILKEKVRLPRRIEVIEKRVDTLPKTKEECPKCGNKEAYYWTVQTRAADEAATQFFKCTKCNYTWRSYS